MRGLGLPGWDFAVTVPISTKPNPSAARAGIATPFLSKPAARPMGVGKVSPKSLFGFGSGANRSSWRSTRGRVEAARSARIARLCAASADRVKSAGLTTNRYMSLAVIFGISRKARRESCSFPDAELGEERVPNFLSCRCAGDFVEGAHRLSQIDDDIFRRKSG